MNINFHESKSLSDQSIRTKIESAIHFYSKKLPDKYRNLRPEQLDGITINIVDSSDNHTDKADASIRRLKKDNSQFSLNIKEFNGEKGENDILMLLAHELCHLAQLVTGMMDDSIDNDRVIWLGEPYTASSMSTWEIEMSPWEKDARKNQLYLYSNHPECIERYKFFRYL